MGGQTPSRLIWGLVAGTVSPTSRRTNGLPARVAQAYTDIAADIERERRAR
jgi:hypothetical protein